MEKSLSFRFIFHVGVATAVDEDSSSQLTRAAAAKTSCSCPEDGAPLSTDRWWRPRASQHRNPNQGGTPTVRKTKRHRSRSRRGIRGVRRCSPVGSHDEDHEPGRESGRDAENGPTTNISSFHFFVSHLSLFFSIWTLMITTIQSQMRAYTVAAHSEIGRLWVRLKTKKTLY